MKNIAYIASTLNCAILYEDDRPLLFMVNGKKSTKEPLDGYALSQFFATNPEIKEVTYTSIADLNTQLINEHKNHEAFSMVLELMDSSFSANYRSEISNLLISEISDNPEIFKLLQNRLLSSVLPDEFEPTLALNFINSNNSTQLFNLYDELKTKSALFDRFYTIFKLELDLEPLEQELLDSRLTDAGCYSAFTVALYEKSKYKFANAVFEATRYLKELNILNDERLFSNIEKKLNKNYRIQLKNDVFSTTIISSQLNNTHIEKVIFNLTYPEHERLQNEKKNKFEPIKILLIDDDEINNFISMKLIKKALFNTEIMACLNGKFAIDQLVAIQRKDPNNLPDYIFVDINMPVMNGWEFLDEYTRLNIDPLRKSKIFIIDSSVFSNNINKARSYPIVKDFISKPLSVEKLKDLLWMENFA